MKWPCIAAVLTAAAFARSSPALCSYNGKLYAKTTIAEEFKDSKWAVRAKVIAADNHWSDEDDSWTIYHLQVLTAFKGQPPLRIEVFTYRDSGGFYLDKGVYNDLGGEYLLFLDPIEAHEHVPVRARNAYQVNYSCGQSKVWTEIDSASQHQLDLLSHGRPTVYTSPLLLTNA